MFAQCRRSLAAVWITAAVLSWFWAVSALWIPLKAQAAQWLLHHSWQQILNGNPQAKPWPWADTRPAAVLSVPALGIRQLVLEGNSGRNLAFGPVFSGALPAGHDRVISGHRDTHFQFLQNLQHGDLIRIETVNGAETYRVESTEVIDSRRQELVLEPAIHRLSLVTCFPFDAPLAGGPLRYVVTALPVTEQVTPLPTASASG